MKNKGFTLVETIVYAAIASIILFAIINALMLVTNMYRNFDSARNIQDGAIAVIERIVSESRNASVVNVGGSPQNGDTISMTNTDGDVIQFSVLSGAVHVFKNGVDIGPLTSQRVTIVDLTFRYSENEQSQLVKMELTLQSRDRVERFYTSVVLRGAYST